MEPWELQKGAQISAENQEVPKPVSWKHAQQFLPAKKQGKEETRGAIAFLLPQAPRREVSGFRQKEVVDCKYVIGFFQTHDQRTKGL